MVCKCGCGFQGRRETGRVITHLYNCRFRKSGRRHRKQLTLPFAPLKPSSAASAAAVVAPVPAMVAGRSDAELIGELIELTIERYEDTEGLSQPRRNRKGDAVRDVLSSSRFQRAFRSRARKLVYTKNLPFSFFEDTLTTEFIDGVFTDIAGEKLHYRLPSASYMRGEGLDREFEDARQQLRARILDAGSVDLVVDGWSWKSGRKKIFGIVVQCPYNI